MSVTCEELAEEFSRLFPKGSDSASSETKGESDSDAAPASPPVCQLLDYSKHGCHLDLTVLPTQVVAAAEWLDRNGFGFDAVTGVDWLAAGEMEVVYDYFHPLRCLRVAVRARVPRDEPKIPTLCRIFPGANWHERETHDFFGIQFEGHPDLSPLLLPEDADFHPLRKDYGA